MRKPKNEIMRLSNSFKVLWLLILFKNVLIKKRTVVREYMIKWRHNYKQQNKWNRWVINKGLLEYVWIDSGMDRWMYWCWKRWRDWEMDGERVEWYVCRVGGGLRTEGLCNTQSLICSPGDPAVCRSTPGGVQGWALGCRGECEGLALGWAYQRVHHPPLPYLLPEIPVQMAMCQEWGLQA